MPISPRIRTCHHQDYASVRQLYADGLLMGELDPADTAADLDYPEEAYFSHPRDHLWVAVDESEQVLGSIAVQHDRDGVAEIRRLRVSDRHEDPQALCARLLRHALEHCRKAEALKVILDTHLDPETAYELVRKSGFNHHRSRTDGVKTRIEFYLDLYHDPQRRPNQHDGLNGRYASPG